MTWTSEIIAHLKNSIFKFLSHNPKAESSETKQVWVEKPIYSMDFYSENMAESARKKESLCLWCSL